MTTRHVKVTEGLTMKLWTLIFEIEPRAGLKELNASGLCDARIHESLQDDEKDQLLSEGASRSADSHMSRLELSNGGAAL